MSQILFANNAQSTLAGGISSTATTASLAIGTGALFPNPSAGQYFVMTFTDTATGLLNEIIHVTAISGDTITMVRGQEGTDALSWQASDLANNRLTAGQMSALAQSTSLRTPLPAGTTTFYVSTTGNDTTGNGSSGAPWATGQHAVNMIQDGYDFDGDAIALVQFADGTYGNSIILNGPLVGANGTASLVLAGNSGAPTNVFFSTTGPCVAAENGGQMTVQNVKVQSSASDCLVANTLAALAYSGITFGTAGTFSAHVTATLNAVALQNGNCLITGGASTHFHADVTSTVILQNGGTDTVTGTPAFTNAFAYATHNGCIDVGNGGYSITGAATGNRYSAMALGMIDTNVGGANFFPGSIAGTTATGGQYA